MINPCFPLVSFLLVACRSLTINQSTHLLSPSPFNATTSLLNPGDIPNPFIYQYSESLRLVATRQGGGHLDPAGNPGVSPFNWAHAIEDAGWDASAMRRNARAGPKDHVPNNSFNYEDTLLRPAGAHRIPRRIRIKITGANAIFGLNFENIHTVLNGLREYAKIWQRGSKNAQVKMCHFRLMWRSDLLHEHEVGKGFVNLIIEPSIDSRDRAMT